MPVVELIFALPKSDLLFYLELHQTITCHQNILFILPYSDLCVHFLLQFLRHLKEWLDWCGSHDLSNSVEDCERLITSHEEMRESYQSVYSLAMKDSQQLREGLMNHMGMAKGNTPSHSSLSVHLQRVQVCNYEE